MKTKQNVTRLKAVETNATGDAEALGLETWQPWVQDDVLHRRLGLARQRTDSSPDRATSR